ncbi:MAG TPA: hypothetical protein VFU43_29405 [Streptosporangiaceae bacterium]|nr:hypothetical protein [Streptosporangiaceae bacterium]
MSARNGEDRRWLVDTLTRISLRYGRAVHELSQVPAALALAHLSGDPAGQDARDAAEAIGAVVAAAVAELVHIDAYACAITRPDDLYPLTGADRPRPDWRACDQDLTGHEASNSPMFGDSPMFGEDPGGTHHQASPPGSLRKEQFPS